MTTKSGGLEPTAWDPTVKLSYSFYQGTFSFDTTSTTSSIHRSSRLDDSQFRFLSFSLPNLPVLGPRSIAVATSCISRHRSRHRDPLSLVDLLLRCTTYFDPPTSEIVTPFPRHERLGLDLDQLEWFDLTSSSQEPGVN
jgi:hypothetical protein